MQDTDVHAAGVEVDAAVQLSMDAPQHKLPDDPLAFIRACVRQQSLFWTYHVNMRLQHRDEVFHILFATDITGDNVRIVTAYRPSSAEWERDGKTRRTP